MKDLFDTVERYEKALTKIYSKINVTSGCHEWIGPVKNNGYGQITLTIATNTTKNFYAHRLLYVLECGIIPAGKELHHVCFNRTCVNPNHLQVVTHAQNMKMLSPAQKPLATHCGRGHEYTEQNTLWTAGRRMCRECKRYRERNYRKAKSSRTS